MEALLSSNAQPTYWGENVPYTDALSRLGATHHQRQTGLIPDQFYYLTHEPIITYGRATTPTDLAARPHHIPTLEVPRGGLATYHGPGQLIGYIVMDLTQRANNLRPDIHAYLRAIEEGLINFLQSEYNLPAIRREGFTGVWTHGCSGDKLQWAEPAPLQRGHSCPAPNDADLQSGAIALAEDPAYACAIPPTNIPRKLASIGVSARKWVTSHGFALNLHPDMDAFESIIPCGITDAEMTSVEHEHQRAGLPYHPHPMEQLAQRAHSHIIAALQFFGWCTGPITND